MNIEIILMFSVLLLTIVLFIFEVFSIDKIAFFVIVSLILLGLVSPEEGISGFSNNATITVLSLMILAVAMEENGVINWLTSGMSSVKSLPLYIMAPVFMFVTAGISAFISTTAVVIVFIKMINQLSEKYNISQSKLLLPISFAGILGGSCTLMGTSTNLIVNSVSSNLVSQKLEFFEFSHLGLIFLIISVVYITLTLRWLPWGKKQNINKDYKIDNYITKVKVTPKSKLIGKNIYNSFLYNNPEVILLKLIRNNYTYNSPGKYITLKANDQLILMCDLENLSRINKSANMNIYDKENLNIQNNEPSELTEAGEEMDLEERVFVELLMLPGATLLGKTLGNLRYFMMPDIIPIAIRKRKTLVNVEERMVHSSEDKLRLKAGDRLLVEISKEKLSALNTMTNMVVLQEFGSVTSTSKIKRSFSFFVFLLVIALAASGVLSIMVSALTGISILLVTKNLDLNTVYKKVNWQIFFLLAGMIPLGVAMHNTGADMWISEKLLGFLDGQPNYVIIGTLFLITMLLSGVVSNNATAVIMTPIAISVAYEMGLDYKPFILSVMFAANFSFFTPVGYQTNTLIYGIGNYKFQHFLWIGGGLSLILWLVATFLLTKML